MKRLWILALTGFVLMLLLTLTTTRSMHLDGHRRRPAAASGAPARAGIAPPIRSTRPELPGRAELSAGDAWRIAERSLSDGVPVAGTLRELGGRLVYVLEFRLAARRSGEVIVDARSGSVISVHRSGTGEVLR